MHDRLKATPAVEGLRDNLPQRAYLEQFRQQDSWYTYGQFDSHGAFHQSRVLILANLALGFFTKKIGVNFPQTIKDAVSWTAVIHDTQIKPVWQGRYLIHGQDAADWVGVNLRDKMDSEVLDKTQYYCRLHVPDDKHIDKKQDTLTLTGLLIFKDADALDRVRFPFYNLGARLDNTQLRFPFIKENLLPVAIELSRRTRDKKMPCNEAFDLVMGAAVDMGIVK